MTIIHLPNPDLEEIGPEYKAIYNGFINGTYGPTHDYVSDLELLYMPKVFVKKDFLVIEVKPQWADGNRYLHFCRSFDCSIDRVHGIIFLKVKKKDSNCKISEKWNVG